MHCSMEVRCAGRRVVVLPFLLVLLGSLLLGCSHKPPKHIAELATSSVQAVEISEKSIAAIDEMTRDLQLIQAVTNAGTEAFAGEPWAGFDNSTYVMFGILTKEEGMRIALARLRVMKKYYAALAELALVDHTAQLDAAAAQAGNNLQGLLNLMQQASGQAVSLPVDPKDVITEVVKHSARLAVDQKRKELMQELVGVANPIIVETVDAIELYLSDTARTLNIKSQLDQLDHAVAQQMQRDFQSKDVQDAMFLRDKWREYKKLGELGDKLFSRPITAAQRLKESHVALHDTLMAGDYESDALQSEIDSMNEFVN